LSRHAFVVPMAALPAMLHPIGHASTRLLKCFTVFTTTMACTLFRLTPEEALRGVTQHAAQALGYAESRGQIKTGYDADLAIWQIEHPADLSYQVGTQRLFARVVDGQFEQHKECCDE
uniref:amidohydrolase family protein n=1 Tax=Vibrio vulnificus TaxID=672 RepID=UPI001EE9D196